MEGSMPNQPSLSPSICRSQSVTTCSSSVAAGDVFQSIAFTSSVAVSISAKIPGTAADVNLTIANRGQLAADLSAGRLDAVFTLDSGPPAVGPVAVVGHSEVVLVAAPDHPLTRVFPLTLDALRQTEFLVTERGCIYRQCFDEFGRDVGPTLRIGMITGSLNALRRLAVLGRGPALLPRFCITPELESGDLVMLDVTLPGIDGWEMLRRVRERHGIETLPVIMFSGESEDDHAEEHGANTFVGKPLDPLALVEQAKALLRVRVTQFG